MTTFISNCCGTPMNPSSDICPSCKEHCESEHGEHMETVTRVEQIMKELKLNTDDEQLVVNMMIMYIAAQRDYIAEQLKELHNK